MKFSAMGKPAFVGAILLLSLSSHAALVDNGGGLIYDTVLDITWAQPDALRNWDDANAWASGLTLGGASGWRLPFSSVASGAGPLASPVDCSTADEFTCRDNEMGYMFYYNLGGTDGNPILGSGDPDLALFPSLQSDYYWTGTVFTDGIDVWEFSFGFGGQFDDDPGDEYYTWAVHAGNIGAVPVPAAIWLFGSALAGLTALRRKRD